MFWDPGHLECSLGLGEGQCKLIVGTCSWPSAKRSPEEGPLELEAQNRAGCSNLQATLLPVARQVTESNAWGWTVGKRSLSALLKEATTRLSQGTGPSVAASSECFLNKIRKLFLFYFKHSVS